MKCCNARQMIYLYSCLLWINTIADTMNVRLAAAGHIRRRLYLKSSLMIIGRVTRLFVTFASRETQPLLNSILMCAYTQVSTACVSC